MREWQLSGFLKKYESWIVRSISIAGLVASLTGVFITILKEAIRR